MALLAHQVMEFFDRETDTSARAGVQRLKVGSACLRAALEENRFDGRILDIVDQGLELAVQPSDLSQAGAEFLAAALRVLRHVRAPALHDRAVWLANARLSHETSAPFHHELALGALARGWLDVADSALKRSPDAALSARRHRLLGELQKAQPLVTTENAKDDCEARWQAALNEAAAHATALPLVLYFKDYPEGRDDATRRLSAYLVATALTTLPLHHRLLAPDTIGRKLVRRRQDSPALVALLDACLAVEALAQATNAFAAIKAVGAAVAAVEEVDDVELRLFAFLAAQQKLPSTLGDYLRPLTEKYAALCLQVTGKAGLDPYPRLPAPAKDPGALDFASSVVRRLLSRPGRTDGSSSERAVARDSAAIRSWLEYRLPGVARMDGLELKTLRYQASVLSALEGQPLWAAEQVFLSYPESPLDDETVARLARDHGITVVSAVAMSGSIGNVHRGRLATGQDVAIKINRPDIARRIVRMGQRQKMILDVVSKALRDDALSRLSAGFLEAAVLQCDLGLEARNQAAFHALFAPGSGVRVPRIFADVSSPDQLVQEVALGEDFYQFLGSATQAERDRAGFALARFMMTGLRHGLYYYDSHPGNLRFAGEEVWVLDYGSVLPTGPGVGQFIAKIAAIEADDRDAFRRLIEEEGSFESSDQNDWNRYFQRHRELYLAPFLARRPFRISATFLKDVMVGLLYEDRNRGGKVPSGMAVTNLRFYLAFYGILASLEAEADWRSAIPT